MSAVPVIELTEASASPPCALTTAQVVTLVAVPDLVAIAPTGSGLWRLVGRQRVGTVRLGIGEAALELRIHPKIPVDHLMYLVAFATGSSVWRHGQVGVAKADLLVAAVADAFARSAEQAMRGGVLHGYVAREDSLTVVRGRIRTSSQLSRRPGLAVPIEVAFDDYTADIAENRILLGAIEHLQSLPGVSAPTKALLRHLAARLVEVVPVRAGAAPLPAWTPNRLNERHLPALRLAELVLGASSFQQKGSPALQVDGFVLNMAEIFERFLTTRLTELLQPYGLRCAGQQGHHRLDRSGSVLFRPDIVAYGRGRPAAVIDAKYRELGGPPPTSHLFQLISYCTALGIRDGHLVYAAGGPAAMPYRITQSDITVTAHVLDLALPPEQLNQALHRIAEMLASGGSGDRTTATA
ncbi:McrC family protein [Microbispora bryophytorum]|uniref:McrC family protein n=1 Tax=Microbispora bryophytorum TaxID=1460882 RepID=UPI00340550C1